MEHVMRRARWIAVRSDGRHRTYICGDTFALQSRHKGQATRFDTEAEAEKAYAMENKGEHALWHTELVYN